MSLLTEGYVWKIGDLTLLYCPINMFLDRGNQSARFIIKVL